MRPAVSLALLVAAVFGPAVTFDFVRWDDAVNVTQNPLITEPWSFDLLARLVNGDTALRFKPLPWLLCRGIHAAFGFHPAAWHAAGVMLHLVAVWLFHAVLRTAIERWRPGTPVETRDGLAWAGAALWAVHPAHVEAACWVTASSYPLLALCLLGSFRCYLRATDPAAPEGFRRNLGWAWLLAVAGYACYPVGVTYALWLVVVELWIFPRAPQRWLSWKETVPWLARHALFLVPAVIGVLVTWKSSSTTPWLYPAPPTLGELGLPDRLKMSAATLGSVWKNLLWPFGQTPNNPILPAWRLNDPAILALAAAALIGVATAWLGRRRRPGVAGAVLGTAVVALPVLGFAQWPHWEIADRYTYLPHLVPTGALVFAAAAWPGFRAQKAGWTAVLLALVAFLAWLGHRQVMIWRNTDTLFGYMERHRAFSWNASQQAYIYQIWAAHAREQGRLEEAQAKTDQARRTLQRGMVEAVEHEAWSEAVERSRLLEQSFGLPPALRRERVRWLLALDRWREAGADLERTLREMPGDGEAQDLLREWQARGAANHL